MKKIYLVAAALAFFSCKNSDTAAQVETSEIDSTQVEISQTQQDTTEMEETPLIGEITGEDLQTVPFNNWYESNYSDFSADEATVTEIGKHINNYEIVVFMGTWCSDSQREVPQLFNLLEKVNYNEENLTIYAVNEDKEIPNNKHKEYNVEYVPTIIFMKNGKEANRFVEYAQESLAQDILKIVKGEEYRNPYAE